MPGLKGKKNRLAFEFEPYEKHYSYIGRRFLQTLYWVIHRNRLEVIAPKDRDFLSRHTQLYQWK